MHRVWGKVSKVTRTQVTICHWEHLNGEDEEHCKTNSEYSNVLIKDVVGYYRLMPS